MRSKLTFVCIACLLFSSMAAFSSPVYTVLATFTGANGATPEQMSLVQGFDGNFYGTTAFGGANGYGTVFKITRSGTLTTLYSFCALTDCTDGAEPYAGLVLATNGNFYGTTFIGGESSEAGGGFGTIFEITPAGVLTTLHIFDSSDGENPNGALIQASDGTLYGTTTRGGIDSAIGAVFKISTAGAFSLLFTFVPTAGGQYLNGAYPSGPLVQGTNGNFYGTTQGNPAACCGTVFEITPEGALTTLYSFDGTDGEAAWGGVIQATNGNLYGTTFGGPPSSAGTVFELTPSGTLTNLFAFGGVGGNGLSPYAGLIQATDGSLWGTTSRGGAANGAGPGTIFSITTAGKLTTQHRIQHETGLAPYGGLLQATDGDFYGTTNQGGDDDGGVVFRLSTGLAPFVKLLPAYGQAGAAINILGTSLAGATSVTFNGIPAAFTVASPTLITTTVPAGAASGKIEVSTHGGTPSGNVPFLVLK